MNPTIHRPIELELEPVGPPAPFETHQLHALRLRYRHKGHMQVFLATHVPKSLIPFFQAGEVTAVHLETLEHDSAEQQQLYGWPNYVVLGVETTSGARHVEIPLSFQRLRARRLLAGGACLLVGAGLLTGPSVFGGAALFALAALLLRKAISVPAHAFKGQEIQG